MALLAPVLAEALDERSAPVLRAQNILPVPIPRRLAYLAHGGIREHETRDGMWTSLTVPTGLTGDRIED